MLKKMFLSVLTIATLCAAASAATLTATGDSLTFVVADKDVGFPYCVAGYDCRLFVGSDMGPLVYLVGKPDSLRYTDRDTMISPHAFHSNHVQRFRIGNEFKTFLFQGTWQALIVYKVSNGDSTLDYTCGEDYPDTSEKRWTEDVFCHDTVVYCATAQGLRVYDFSPATESLSFNRKLGSTHCYGVVRCGNYVYVLRKQEQLPSSPLIFEKYDVGNNYSVKWADTTSADWDISEGTGYRRMAIVTDSFTISNSTSVKTLVFTAFPASKEVGNENVYFWALWILDAEGESEVLMDSTFLSSMERWLGCSDIKYVDGHLFFIFQSQDCVVYDVRNIDSIDSVTQVHLAYQWEIVIGPQLDTIPIQSIFLTGTRLEEGPPRQQITTLYRYVFDNNGSFYVAGDWNGDSLVNVEDFLGIYYYTLGNYNYGVPDPLIIGDVNGDGYVNLADADYLIWYLFDGGNEPLEYCRQ